MSRATAPFKIVVADDIPDTLELICSLTEEVCPSANIVAKCTSVAQTKEAIERCHPDVILVDIQFAAEGTTIFNLLEEYKKKENMFFDVIIFSGNCEKEYYDMAFCYKAIHFLPKPIEKARLKEALERTQAYTIEEAPQSIDKLFIRTVTSTHIIDIHDIVFLNTKNNGTSIVLSNSQEIFSSRNIGYYQKEIGDVPNFLRIHHSTIVNLAFIQGFTNSTDRSVILSSPFPNLKCSKDGFKRLTEILK